jgi:two-component system alkaline phosphatase synthesis response regulator PhoP
MEQTADLKRILVIEDDAHIAEGLRLNLMLQGYEVLIAPDGLSGSRLWKEARPDLILLDIMLPGIDGLSLLQSIRLENERVPILILSAKGEPDDRVKGFSLGVDDYLAKPFHLEELLLRVDRLLTRGAWTRERMGGNLIAPAEVGIYEFGGNRIDFDAHTAECREGRVLLTEQEIRLLKLFVSNPGKPLARDRLLEIGWGYTKGVTTRTLDNFIVRFRKYFEEEPKRPRFFKSLRGVGYIFDC